MARTTSDEDWLELNGTDIELAGGSEGIQGPGTPLIPRDHSNGAQMSHGHEPPGGQFFRQEPLRRIDLVLAFKEEDEDDEEKERKERRRKFQENLEKEGLQLELEEREDSCDEKTSFVKVHIPWGPLTKNAENLSLKMPLKGSSPKEHYSNKCWPFYCDIFNFDRDGMPEPSSFSMAPFIREKEHMFMMDDRETAFTPAQRSFIVWRILRTVKFDDSEKVGIRSLLHSETYLAAFPLHEGKTDMEDNSGQLTDRQLLIREWGRPSKVFKAQPIFLIRRYFGEKVALYFAWLGFYTLMLIPAAVVGVLCFVYSLATMHSPDNIPSKDVCNMSGPGNLTLCPLCESTCRYEKLGNSCTFSYVSTFFDNTSTIFYAVFMSFWATTFMEMWKRRQHVLEWDWDLQHLDEEEEVRLEFRNTAKSFRTNRRTGEQIPYVATSDRLLRYLATGITVLFMLVVVAAAVFGVLIYSLCVQWVLATSDNFFFQNNAKLLTSLSAAIINLIVILAMSKVYQQASLLMVKYENHRTEQDYENSYTIKMFVFQFINTYSSIIYLAFFKGRSFVRPGHATSHTSTLHFLRNDVCDPSGCFAELCIQLAIIMVGEQTVNNLIEVLVPVFRNWREKRRLCAQADKVGHQCPVWERDYRLQEVLRLSLFDEYLEMVLQYGFVTLFVAAFPLAPLFGLLNNLLEIRVDAYKILTQTRRPIAHRVQDIGAWNSILAGITRAAVLVNALVIAFTSDFIPRLVYIYAYSPTGNLEGYVQFSLSEFNTYDFDEVWRSDNVSSPSTCWYRGLRNGPEHEDKYELSLPFWNVLAVRLIFVFLFEHVVFLLTSAVAYVIPDVPSKVRGRIQEDKQLIRELRQSLYCTLEASCGSLPTM